MIGAVVDWAVRFVMFPKTRCGRVLLVALILSLVLPVVLFRDDVNHLFQQLMIGAQGLGWLSAVLMSCLSALCMVFLVPSFPLLVSGGVLFTRMYGVWLGATVGTLSIFSGWTVGSVSALCLGRACFKDWSQKQIDGVEIMMVINEMIKQEGWWIILLAKASIFLPLEPFNYACSLTEVSVVDFSKGCVGSLIPIAFWEVTVAQATVAAQGAGAPHIHANPYLIVGSNVVLMGVLSAALYFAYRKYKRKLADALISPGRIASEIREPLVPNEAVGKTATA